MRLSWVENGVSGDVKPLLRAASGEAVWPPPLWLMRQAGRYMAEYRGVRAKVPFLSLCKDPELATEVTVTAAERLGVDAAILFADILLILEPLGFDLEFAAGEGPVGIRIGRQVFYRVASVNEWLRSREKAKAAARAPKRGKAARA